MANLWPPNPTGAEAEIRRRIAADGPLTFADFMGLALYARDGGFYTSGSPFGAGGDFYTAPLTHPAFGALVARHAQELWQAAGSPERWWLVEAGAGGGQLSRDVLAASDGTFAQALRYMAIDQSARAADAAVAQSAVAWVRADALPVRGLRGMVLANELLDALPVHRVTIADGVLREIRVGVDDDGRFEDVLTAPTPGIAERLAALDVRLGEGHRAEVCLAVDDWFADAGRAMEAGYLVLIDYGHEAGAYYDASRARGTLRTYYQHLLGMDPYRHVGRQDISVHVEWTSVRRAAMAAGFTPAGATTQAAFLRELGFDGLRAAMAARRDVPTPVRVANLRALDTLVDPEGMGGFSVMAFAKGVPDVGVGGFGVGDELGTTFAGPAPLATAAHMPFGGAATAPMDMRTWDELTR
jgi:SAM-dependent MidA family methyltransferase